MFFTPSMLLPVQGRKKLRPRLGIGRCVLAESLGKRVLAGEVWQDESLFCYLSWCEKTIHAWESVPTSFCACVVTEKVAYRFYHIEINTCKLD